MGRILKSMTARAAITARARSTPASRPTEGVPAALGINHGQLALYVLSAACVAGDGLIGFAERTQDFIFFFAVKTNVFVDWHVDLLRQLYSKFDFNRQVTKNASNSQYGFAGLPNPARKASDLAIRASKSACILQNENCCKNAKKNSTFAKNSPWRLYLDTWRPFPKDTGTVCALAVVDFPDYG
jgi:hypothetical protein